MNEHLCSPWVCRMSCLVLATFSSLALGQRLGRPHDGSRLGRLDHAYLANNPRNVLGAVVFDAPGAEGQRIEAVPFQLRHPFVRRNLFSYYVGSYQTCPTRVVTRTELLAAMRQHGPYDIVATTNWGRFQTEVFLRLITWSRSQDPESGSIVIMAEDWYRAYLDVAGLTDSTAPEGTRLSHEVGQTILLDFPPHRVVRTIRRGPEPKLAANVRISWPAKPGVPDKYSYSDTLSVPHLKVTSHRLITYRLLDLGGMVLYDDIKGVSGRPTSGVLGALFAILGEGSLVESRMASGADDILVVRARSKKIFSRTVTVTVLPNGRGDEGIPPGRPDLAALEKRLREPLDYDYFPYTC